MAEEAVVTGDITTTVEGEPETGSGADTPGTDAGGSQTIDLSKFKKPDGGTKGTGKDVHKQLAELKAALDRSEAARKNTLAELREYKSGKRQPKPEQDVVDPKIQELQAELETLRSQRRLDQIDEVISALQVKDDTIKTGLRDAFIGLRSDDTNYDVLGDLLKQHIGSVLEQQERSIIAQRTQTMAQPREGSAQSASKTPTLADLKAAMRVSK